MGLRSRSDSIAPARETITIDRVRAPSRGGGRRNLDYGYESAATPRQPAEKDHPRAAKLTSIPLLAQFVGC
jgi:hypothetical protein